MTPLPPKTALSRRIVTFVFIAMVCAVVVQVWQQRTHAGVEKFMDVQKGWEGGREEWARGQGQLQARGDAIFLPPEWNSTACMQLWGLPRLQTEPDPAGLLRAVLLGYWAEAVTCPTHTCRTIC